MKHRRFVGCIKTHSDNNGREPIYKEGEQYPYRPIDEGTHEVQHPKTGTSKWIGDKAFYEHFMVVEEPVPLRHVKKLREYHADAVGRGKVAYGVFVEAMRAQGVKVDDETWEHLSAERRVAWIEAVAYVSQ